VNKWYDEEYEFEVEVTGYLRGDSPVRYCRNGEEIGDKYTCTYGCPVNKDGSGICSKTMIVLYPLMEAVRSGGDLTNLGGSGKYVILSAPTAALSSALPPSRSATLTSIRAVSGNSSKYTQFFISR